MAADWTNQKPFLVKQAHVAVKHWGGSRDGKMRCGLCGEAFAAGDTARWQFTNDIPDAGGNPFVCVACDGTKEQICEELRTMRREYGRLKGILGRHLADELWEV